jgi:hypothetical protein
MHKVHLKFYAFLLILKLKYVNYFQLPLDFLFV